MQKINSEMSLIAHNGTQINTVRLWKKKYQKYLKTSKKAN